GLAGIRRTVVGGAVAALRRVAGAGRRPADRRALGVGRAGGGGPRAVLGRIAHAGRGPAHGGRRLERVRGAIVRGPVALLVDVAAAGGRAAHRARVAGGMLAGVARAVALVHSARVGVARARRSRGTLVVRRAVRSGPGAVLRRVALPRRSTALDEGRQEAVRRAGRARSRACLDVVAGARRRPADRAGVAGRVLAGVARAVALVEAARVAVARARRPGRLLGVGRAHRARAGARLARVALARRRTADRSGVAGRMLAVGARAIALVEAARVAVVRAGRPRGTLVVRRAAGRRPRAVLRRVAFARRSPAHDKARQEIVGRTDRARPGAVLVHIAGAGGRTAHGSRIPRRVLAGVVRPVALVAAARVAVARARRPRRLLDVRRAIRSAAGTVLCRVALARRGAADRGRRLEGVGRTDRAGPCAVLVDVAC